MFPVVSMVIVMFLWAVFNCILIALTAGMIVELKDDVKENYFSGLLSHMRRGVGDLIMVTGVLISLCLLIMFSCDSWGDMAVIYFSEVFS